MQARLTDRRWFRVLTVVDQFTRECLLLHGDLSMSGSKVAAALEPVIQKHGKPQSITCDNGLNASEKVRMSAEEVCSTQACELSARLASKKAEFPEVVFHE